MTRDEAVSRFESNGFRAFKRDWSMGETVGAGILKPEVEGLEIECFAKLIYIFPIKGEWGIHAPNILSSTNYSRRYSMEDACDIAQRFLECEHLPFDPDTVLTHQIRAEAGGCQLLEHVPTGITKSFGSEGEVLQKRHEALDDLAHDLACHQFKPDESGGGQR